MQQIHNLIILGAGPAGYSAAIYAKRAGLNPVIIQGLEPGGQLMTTTHVENYPGFSSIMGPQLMENMRKQIEELGVEFINDYIISTDLSSNPYKLVGSKTTYITKSLIIATGSTAKWLDVKGIKDFKGYGISACATCDGFFFKDQVVAVVGGGNSALEEAQYLSNIASLVYLIHRRDTFRGEEIMINRIKNNPKIEIIYNTEIKEAYGNLTKKELEGLELYNNKTNQTNKLSVNGLFIAIGHSPNTKFLVNQLDLDETGYIMPYNNGTQATFKGIVKQGIFAAGDVRDNVYRQAITSAGFGCMAALDAQKFLNHS
jgi:thioredoxin reductase (NADPH)